MKNKNLNSYESRFKLTFRGGSPLESYPVPESNRHSFLLVFETSASTDSANWAIFLNRDAKLLISFGLPKKINEIS